MRLPREAYQMQQMIETHLPHLSQAQLGRAGPVGVRGYPGRSAGQNAVASASHPGATGTAGASISGSGCTTAGTGASRPDRAGRNALLRAAAQMGPDLVVFRPVGPGG